MTYIWMCIIVFIGLIAYNEHVVDEKDKATNGEIALMTLIAPVFIGVALGILAADQVKRG